MTADPLTDEVSKRICNHMNRDHLDSVHALAQYYCGLNDIKSALMVSISETNILIEANGRQLKIPFQHQISNSDEAHRIIVQMIRQIPEAS